MAVLQLQDIDDQLYLALKNIAKKEHRSVSQEVIMMIESYIGSPPNTSAAKVTEDFLNLFWTGDEQAEELASSIRKQRVNSKRFASDNELFD